MNIEGLVPSDFFGVYNGDGQKMFFKNGKLHRLDGPAIFHFNGWPSDWDDYYIDGKEVSETEFWNHPLVIANKLKTILLGE